MRERNMNIIIISLLWVLCFPHDNINVSHPLWCITFGQTFITNFNSQRGAVIFRTSFRLPEASFWCSKNMSQTVRTFDFLEVEQLWWLLFRRHLHIWGVMVKFYFSHCNKSYQKCVADRLLKILWNTTSFQPFITFINLNVFIML